MIKRKITDIYNLKFKPFDNYGKEVPGMKWHKISYDKVNGGSGTYVLKWNLEQKVYFMNILDLKNF